MTISSTFGLPENAYDLIMADPPWSYKNYSTKGEGKGAAGQYSCMDLAAIKALPVATLGKRDCLLWLWATNPLLPDCMSVLTAWCFQFKTAGHWSKKTRGGKQAFGTGYVLRSAGEPFLIGTRGKPKTSRSVRSVIEGVVREHSRKPKEAFDAAVALMPEAKRVELFSRQLRPGWDNWGDQANKFDELGVFA